MSEQPQRAISIPELLSEGHWRLVFHGTAQDFDRFTEGGVGKGGDCNSALGVHVAEWPATSVEYATYAYENGEGPGRHVLAVLVPAELPTQIVDSNEFFGLDDDGSQKMDYQDFASLRSELKEQGYDIVDYEDGDAPISVSLYPERILVVANLTLDQAAKLDKRIRMLKDPLSAVDRYKALGEVLAPAPARGMAL